MIAWRISLSASGSRSLPFVPFSSVSPVFCPQRSMCMGLLANTVSICQFQVVGDLPADRFRVGAASAWPATVFVPSTRGAKRCRSAGCIWTMRRRVPSLRRRLFFRDHYLSLQSAPRPAADPRPVAALFFPAGAGRISPGQSRAEAGAETETGGVEGAGSRPSSRPHSADSGRSTMPSGIRAGGL